MSEHKGPPIYRIRICTWWGRTKKKYDVNEGTMRYLIVSLLSDQKYSHRGINRKDKIVITKFRKSWWKRHIIDEFPEQLDPNLF